jgi:hypothetical protein
MSTEDWFIIDKSPITGACLWKHVDGTQVAACNHDEEPVHATAWISGVSVWSQRLVAVVFYRRYWHEYQYAD